MYKEIDIPYQEYKTHVYISGELTNSSKVIILLHGGPGGAAIGNLPLFGLSNYGYTVIAYDQLGCGKSSSIKGKFDLYKAETFVNELENLINYFKLNNFSIIGHSWGGMLAQEYMIRKQDKRVDKLVLFSTLSSTKAWNLSNLEISLSLLNNKNKIRFQKAYDSGDFNSLRIKYIFKYKIWNKFYKRKLNTSPIKKKPKYKLNKELYEYMWGKFDLFGTGTLKNWDVSKQINCIKNNTLILYGKYDQSTEKVNQEIHNGIKNSSVIYLKDSGHGGYYNQYKFVIDSIINFLNN